MYIQISNIIEKPAYNKIKITTIKIKYTSSHQDKKKSNFLINKENGDTGCAPYTTPSTCIQQQQQLCCVYLYERRTFVLNAWEQVGEWVNLLLLVHTYICSSCLLRCVAYYLMARPYTDSHLASLSEHSLLA